MTKEQYYECYGCEQKFPLSPQLSADQQLLDHHLSSLGEHTNEEGIIKLLHRCHAMVTYDETDKAVYLYTYAHGLFSSKESNI